MPLDDREDRDEVAVETNGAVRVVGIGASAGGLEALEQYFEHVLPTTGAAFVVVQHLSPNHKSLMSELLARRTRMKINVAEHGMRIEPNQVYLIPPQNFMTVEQGTLLLSPYVPDQGINLPIDAFLSSLAASMGREAVGIILSGTGSDGTRGIRAIHEAGGIVMVQDEDSAKFDGMPKSAISTGIVHYVQTPDLLAQHVNNALLDGVFPTGFAPLGNRMADISEDERLQQIFQILKHQIGVDFSGYKHAGVMRRIERRIKLNQLETMDEYLSFLAETPAEITALQKDLLIGVTHFFRDPEAFAIIFNKIIPAIVENKIREKEHEVRVWVAGCSTGEEAYTFAMLFKQYLHDQNLDLNIRIFATDLDEESIAYASQGIYPTGLEKDVPAEYVSHYFVRKGDVYQVKKEIRKMIVFAPHNIAKDPPFIHLDLVSCRNMMIYFQPDTQKKVLSLFHFALQKDGYLFLGPSESIGKLTHLFKPYDKKWNIYEYHNEQVSLPISNTFDMSSDLQESNTPAAARASMPLTGGQTLRKLDEVYLTLIEEYMPPSVIIDSHNEIVHTYGDLSPYLSLPRGKMSHNLYKMLSTQLSVAVSTGVHKVRKERREVVYKDIKLADQETPVNLNLLVKPFSNAKLNEYIIIMFEIVKRRAEQQVEHVLHLDIDSNANDRIYDLERELLYTKESLQATIEELETSYEELQSTNEELIASNEELQSTNEELQSVNEELFSVNSEHQRKIQELTELNNDMDNFLISTKIGTIFLDRDMCIRRFTPAITRIINLLEVDIGRPINHISHILKYDRLLEDAQQVLTTTRPIEKEIQSLDQRWYSVGILPYRTIDNFIKGVVVTFVDITELKAANRELQKLSYAIHQSPSSILITDVDSQIEYVNPSFTELTGYEADEVIGTEVPHLFTDNMPSEAVMEELNTALKKGEKWKGELKKTRRDGHVYWEDITIIPIKNDQGEIIHYLRLADDITEWKRTEELLRKSEMLSAVGQLAAGIAHEIRNPLTALKGFLQLIQADGEKNETYIKIMVGEFERIETIINELLLLSKPHALSYQQKDVFVILNDVLMLLETQAIMNQVTFTTDLDRDLPQVECVENQIKQVFINILKNAIEAMPDGGTISVSVRTQPNDRLRIRFVDQGVGIPEDQLAKLGQPFFTTKEKGTGLGMMVSHKIIEDHQGYIEISSVVGKGTTIEIVLPTK